MFIQLLNLLERYKFCASSWLNTEMHSQQDIKIILLNVHALNFN